MNGKRVVITLDSGVRITMREEKARELGLWPPVQKPLTPASPRVRGEEGGLKMRPQVENKMLGQAQNKGRKMEARLRGNEGEENARLRALDSRLRGNDGG